MIKTGLLGFEVMMHLSSWEQYIQSRGWDWDFLCHALWQQTPPGPVLILQFHYSDIIMSMMASEITSVSTACSSISSGADQIKHQSFVSLVTGGFPSQRASDVKSVSIWWHHNGYHKQEWNHCETRQIWGIWKLRPAYSPETPNLSQNQWCFVLCDLKIWWMTLENNRASLLCCFKLCATFHSHWWIQTGVTVRKRPIWVKFDDF